MNIFKKILIVVILNQLISFSAMAEETSQPKVDSPELNLQEIALPSEVKDMSKQPGAVFYSTSVKNKVLIPTHFWGEVNKAGLHFIPNDTNLVKGLSMAGGPSGSAKLEDITLTRNMPDGTIKQYNFNLSGGGTTDAYKFKLESGDSVFIKKDRFLEDRAYYTGWIGIAISIISTILVLNKVK
jgi:hypothetical protein